MSLLERACAPKTAAVLSRHRVCIGGKEGENPFDRRQDKGARARFTGKTERGQRLRPLGHSRNAWGFCTGTGRAVKPRIM